MMCLPALITHNFGIPAATATSAAVTATHTRYLNPIEAIKAKIEGDHSDAAVASFVPFAGSSAMTAAVAGSLFVFIF